MPKTLLGDDAVDTKIADGDVDSQNNPGNDDTDLDLINKDTDPNPLDDDKDSKDADDADDSKDKAGDDDSKDGDADGDDKDADADKDGDNDGDDDAKETIEITFDKEAIQVDDEVLGKFKDLAKELGLKSEGAQKIFDLQAELAKKQAEGYEAEQKAWQKELKDDPDYGQDNYEKTVTSAKKAMNAFTTPELRQLLDNSGFGDHPEVVKFAANVGRAMGEADFIDGKHTLSNDDKRSADVLFGDMDKE